MERKLEHFPKLFSIEPPCPFQSVVSGLSTATQGKTLQELMNLQLCQEGGLIKLVAFSPENEGIS